MNKFGLHLTGSYEQWEADGV